MAIPNTNAYLGYRKQADELWNFAVMVCYAVPTLKKNIKGVKTGQAGYDLVKPDFFINDRTDADEQLAFTAEYKSHLAAYLWLSSFAFFESFVVDAVDEVFDFHGGGDALLRVAKAKASNGMRPLPRDAASAKAKLRNRFDHNNLGKYDRATRVLKQTTMRFPSDLLAALGVKRLDELRSELTAVQIPALLADALHLTLTQAEFEAFNGARDTRNKVAHGRWAAGSLKATIGMHGDLRKLATRIDSHLIEHFFIVERP